METVLLVLQFIVSVALIVIVLLQKSKGEGLGSLGGAQLFFDSYSRSEATLEKVTEVLGVLFLLFTIILLAI